MRIGSRGLDGLGLAKRRLSGGTEAGIADSKAELPAPEREILRSAELLPGIRPAEFWERFPKPPALRSDGQRDP